MHQVLQQIPLKKYNTFGIDSVAENLVEITSNEQLKEVMAWAHENKLSPLFIGGGSNILITKPSYPFVIVNRLMGMKKIKENEDHVWVSCGAGEIWHDLVSFCIERDWGGIENLSLIPGTVGAAPMQNIGAYGVEIKEVFESLEAIDLSTFESRTFDRDACQFGYRESVFKKALKHKYLITSVVLKLSKKHEVNIGYGAIRDVLKEKNIESPSIRQVSEAVIEIRQSKLPDPKDIGNAGSFFKNPVISKQQYLGLKETYPKIPGYPQNDDAIKVPAGWLIEQCGWKGKKEGYIGVHSKQALVLVNHGGGKGADIYDLAMRIKQTVVERFAIEITPEVNIL